MRKSVSDRLKEKSIPEPNSGCWLWEGTTWRGYGRVDINGKTMAASRASYSAFVCDPEDMFVLHKCDNPLCINPEHLFLGTQKDNMRDKVEKGRSLKGSSHPMFGRKGAKNPMFGRKGFDAPRFGKATSFKQKLIAQMVNIMQFHSYWGA